MAFRYSPTAVVAQLQVTPDVPLALVQLSASPSLSVLAVSYNQLYAMNKWSITAGVLMSMLQSRSQTKLCV